ncbi:MAG: alpha/beta hydrolase [Gammaproteobacteria bacterium]|nr:MAG: alpha/beta hydrolase [Gammaproteobacteria bacterium]
MTATFHSARFTTADGPQLEYRDYAPVGAPAGLPVLCLHGLTRNARDFEELAPRIAGLGRRIIVPTQRGRGGSDPDPQPERYHPGTYVRDMLGLLGQLGIGRAVFVGTSMGGLMTMITAAHAPQVLAAAVLNDIGPEVDAAGIARIQGYAGKAMSAADWSAAARHCQDIHQIAFPREQGAEFWLQFARRTCRETADGSVVPDYDPAIARTVAPGSSALTDLWPLFAALAPVPTLVIRGAISDILSAATVAGMQRRKPDLQVVTVPDVGHAPFLVEPAAWDGLRGFLAKH